MAVYDPRTQNTILTGLQQGANIWGANIAVLQSGSGLVLKICQNIHPLHFPEMQKVDEYPVLRKLVPFTPIEVDYPEIPGLTRGRSAHEITGQSCCEIWPAKKPAIMSFRHAADMTGLRPVRKGSAEGTGMLF